MFWILAGFDFGTTITNVLRVKLTGLSTNPCWNSCAGMSVFADANTSAGAPLRICVANAFDPANEYFSRESSAGNTSVSDAAASTVIGSKVGIGGAAVAENEPLSPFAALPFTVEEYGYLPAFVSV